MAAVAYCEADVVDRAREAIVVEVRDVLDAVASWRRARPAVREILAVMLRAYVSYWTDCCRVLLRFAPGSGNVVVDAGRRWLEQKTGRNAAIACSKFHLARAPSRKSLANRGRSHGCFARPTVRVSSRRLSLATNCTLSLDSSRLHQHVPEVSSRNPISCTWSMPYLMSIHARPIDLFWSPQ